MRITDARASDAKALAKILADWKHEMAWMPDLHTPQEDRQFLRYLIDSKEMSVLRNWRGPQGFLARDKNVIHALYIAPAWRGRTYGAQLIDRAKAVRDRLELWVFQHNSRAIAFYHREGFVEVDRTDGAGNDEKLPDIRMVWEHE